MSKEAWEVLSNFESYEIVKANYAQRHQRDTNTEHSKEIAACFIQGRSYFQAARDSDKAVKPLLLYYGVVSLSRGLTMALFRGRRESTLCPSHGLSEIKWRGCLTMPAPKFEDIRIFSAKRGTFRELGESTNYISHLRDGSNLATLSYQHDAHPDRIELRLGDLVGRIPALQEQYALWQDEHYCAPLDISTHENFIVLSHEFRERSTWVSKDLFDRILAHTTFGLSEANAKFIRYTSAFMGRVQPGFADRAQPLGVGRTWVTQRYPGGFELSAVQSIFALAYTLGMLVRYFPTHWTGLIRSQFSDVALPTISSATEYVELEFPRLVRNFLLQDAGDELKVIKRLPVG